MLGAMLLVAVGIICLISLWSLLNENILATKNKLLYESQRLHNDINALNSTPKNKRISIGELRTYDLEHGTNISSTLTEYKGDDKVNPGDMVAMSHNLEGNLYHVCNYDGCDPSKIIELFKPLVVENENSGIWDACSKLYALCMAAISMFFTGFIGACGVNTGNYFCKGLMSKK